MIAIFDNFIKDETLLAEIEQNKTELFKDPGNYKYWQGWWNSSATNTAKKIIQYVWGDHCPIAETFNIDGFEYWTGIQSADADTGFQNNLEHHYDKDEAWFKKTKEIVTPIMGSVYYPPNQDFDGGELHVWTDGTQKQPEIIKAKPNRFIIFPAGRYVHCVKSVTSGTRHAMAINLWEKEPYSKQKGLLTIEQ